MIAEVKGHQEGRIGILVIDNDDLKHQIEVSDTTGEIEYHGTDDYPHDPADRTQEEQAIMSQVEARARHAAQQEFPDADILDPLWDPDHIQRGIHALAELDLEVFQREFRDYYEALNDPVSQVPESAEEIDTASFRIYQTFTLTEDDYVDEIEPVAIYYDLADGREALHGQHIDDYTDRISMGHPSMDFEDQFEYEEHFHEMLIAHLMAQIRDIYLNMGEDPPEEYQVGGIGKFTIHGDGIDTRTSE